MFSPRYINSKFFEKNKIRSIIEICCQLVKFLVYCIEWVYILFTWITYTILTDMIYINYYIENILESKLFSLKLLEYLKYNCKMYPIHGFLN